jgi:hypothetical protein
MRQRTLLCRWSNFWPLKTCPWTPNPVNRPILTLVISSDFRKWNHSYKGVVSRICTKSEAIVDWCTRDTKKTVPGVLPAVAETLDPLHKLGRGLLRTEKKTVTQIREALVVATKETGLEVKADKTKYMVMSRDRNAGRGDSVKINGSKFYSGRN